MENNIQLPSKYKEWLRLHITEVEKIAKQKVAPAFSVI